MNCRGCWLVSLLLAVALGYGAYKFIIQGSTVDAEDGRVAVLLTEGERNQVLGEMRAMLEAVQEITHALATGDRAAITAAATPVGMIATQNESPALMGKLPIELKLQGHAVHQGFDDLAARAQTEATDTDLIAALSDHLANCTACHAGYRFDVAP